MLPTVLFPLSRIITAAIVFFTSLFGGMGWDAALNRLPPSLEPLSYPVWVHSHWIWENVGYCETIKDWVADMQAAGIPVAAIIIDRPWEASTHTWTQRHLPREEDRALRAQQRNETGMNGERTMQRDGYGNPVDSVGSYIPCPVRYCCFFEEWYANHRGVPNEGPGFIEYFNNMGIEVLAWGTGMVNTNSPNHWGPVRIDTEVDDGITGIYQDRLEWAAEHDFPMEIPCTSFFMNDGQLVSWWGSHSNYTFRTYGSLLDYTNPAAVDWWEDQLDNVLNLGLSGWKVDGTDPYVATLLPAINHQGRLIGWRSYKYAAYRHWIDYSWENFGAVAKVRAIDDYPFRAGVPFRFAPRQGNFLAWAGDQDNDWRGMRAALNNIFASSMYNYVNVGSDIGGFRGGPYDNPWDVFIRWAQLGAFSTLMEMESTLREVPREFLTPDGNTELRIYTEHRPFRFDGFYPQLAEHGIDLVGIYRDFAIMHTNLQPYIASQVMFSYERRQPTVRPTFGYYQYMLGDEIFVAPIVQQGDYSGHYRRIIFPRGSNWVYLFDETQVFHGGSMHTLHFSYDVTPVFIREGAIIPRINLLDVPVGAPLVFCDYTTIYIYPRQGSNRFGLFEEGRQGSMINYTMTRNHLRITMDPTERDIIFRVFDINPINVAGLDGNLVHATSLDALREAGTGYYVDDTGNLWIAQAHQAVHGIDISICFVSCGCR